MSQTTTFLSRLIGLTLLLLGFAMAVTYGVTVDTVATLMHDRPLLVALAMIELVAGLAIVLSHNIWSSVPAVIVSLIGWLLVIRAMVILLLSPPALFNLFAVFNFRQFYFLYAAIIFVIGVVLTVAGFWRTSLWRSSREAV